MAVETVEQTEVCMNRSFGHAWAGLTRPQHQHPPGEVQPAGARHPLGQVETWGETAAQDPGLPVYVQRYEHARRSASHSKCFSWSATCVQQHSLYTHPQVPLTFAHDNVCSELFSRLTAAADRS